MKATGVARRRLRSAGSSTGLEAGAGIAVIIATAPRVRSEDAIRSASIIPSPLLAIDGHQRCDRVGAFFPWVFAKTAIGRRELEFRMADFGLRVVKCGRARAW